MSGLSLDIGKNGVREPVRRRPALPMVALAILFSLMALLPLGFIIAIGIETGWESIKVLVFRPRVAELLSNTLWLTALAVPLCIVLGVAIAWLTERTTLAGRGIWSALAVAPLAIPAFVQSYAWVSVVPSMHGLSAGVFLSVLAYYPFIYMPVAAVLRRLDPTLEDVAASLGTPPWRVFFRVVLPQLKLAICGGALLVALHLLAEYGLYVMIRFDTFTTAIYDQFQSTFSGPAANMLAGVLASSAVGMLNGTIIAKGGITDFIVTLGALSAASGLALILADGKPIQVINRFLLKLSAGGIGPFSWSVIVAAVVAVVAHVALFNSRFGLHVLATGGSTESARAVGVRTVRVKIAVYTLSGFLAGIAAILLVARVGAAEPASNTSFLLNSVAAVVLGGVSLFGGRATITGPVMGALLLTALVNGLTLLGLSQFYQPLAVGIVVVLAALLTRFQK